MEITTRKSNAGHAWCVFIDGTCIATGEKSRGAADATAYELRAIFKGYIKESDIDEYEIYKKWQNVIGSNWAYLTNDRYIHIHDKLPEDKVFVDKVRALVAKETYTDSTIEPLTPDEITRLRAMMDRSNI